MGHVVTLFLMEEYPHFYPENDTYGPIEGIKVVELKWKHKELFKASKSEIKAVLGGFDIYCGSEFAPAFLFKAGLPLHIFIPIGTDLIDYPFQKPKGLIPPTWAIDEYQFHLYQKGGIRNAGAIFMNLNGDVNLENAVKKIGFKGQRFPVSLPYLYLPDYVSEKAVSMYETEISELRKKYKLLLISHGRCEFLDKDSVHYKGTEIMLEGVATYVQSGNTDVCLVMTQYGNDWKAAKDLAGKLGIAEHIHWLPQCGRKEIFPILKYFDAGFGTLSYPHWSYNVAMELLAAGVPLIQKGPSDPSNSKIYPFMKGRNKIEVSEILDSLIHKESIRNINNSVLVDWFFTRQIEPALLGLKSCIEHIKTATRTSHNLVKVQWIYFRSFLYFLSKVKLSILKGKR